MTDPLLDGDPTRVGPYRLEGRLGEGGMVRVFLGRSHGGYPVAVKVARPELADDARFRRRFAAEAAAARRVGGSHIPQVLDADPNGDPPWLATVYIPGPSLRQAVEERGPLPVKSVAALGIGLVKGLTKVHARKLVHRDLKPANVILAADGPRLIDFGMFQTRGAASPPLTRTVLDTAAFRSPEQVLDQEVGPPSDVFSLGCVLAFAATGRNPFGSGPAQATAYRIEHESPDLSGLSDGLASLVAACLVKDPVARPGLEQVRKELAALVPDRVPDEAEAQEAELFELVTAGMWLGKRVSYLLRSTFMAAVLWSVFTLFPLLFGDNSLAEVRAEFLAALELASWPWLLVATPLLIALLFIFQGGWDLLAVGPSGITVVDRRWVRWRDRSLSLSWDEVESVRMVVDAASDTSHKIVVDRKNWQELGVADWQEMTIATLDLSSGDVERAAMLPRLQAALARFGGSVYQD